MDKKDHENQVSKKNNPSTDKINQVKEQLDEFKQTENKSVPNNISNTSENNREEDKNKEDDNAIDKKNLDKNSENTIKKDNQETKDTKDDDKKEELDEDEFFKTLEYSSYSDDMIPTKEIQDEVTDKLEKDLENEKMKKKKKERKKKEKKRKININKKQIIAGILVVIILLSGYAIYSNHDKLDINGKIIALRDKILPNTEEPIKPGNDYKPPEEKIEIDENIPVVDEVADLEKVTETFKSVMVSIYEGNEHIRVDTAKAYKDNDLKENILHTEVTIYNTGTIIELNRIALEIQKKIVSEIKNNESIFNFSEKLNVSINIEKTGNNFTYKTPTQIIDIINQTTFKDRHMMQFWWGNSKITKNNKNYKTSISKEKLYVEDLGAIWTWNNENNGKEEAIDKVVSWDQKIISELYNFKVYMPTNYSIKKEDTLLGYYKIYSEDTDPYSVTTKLYKENYEKEFEPLFEKMVNDFEHNNPNLHHIETKWLTAIKEPTLKYNLYTNGQQKILFLVGLEKEKYYSTTIKSLGLELFIDALELNLYEQVDIDYYKDEKSKTFKKIEQSISEYMGKNNELPYINKLGFNTNEENAIYLDEARTKVLISPNFLSLNGYLEETVENNAEEKLYTVISEYQNFELNYDSDFDESLDSYKTDQFIISEEFEFEDNILSENFYNNITDLRNNNIFDNENLVYYYDTESKIVNTQPEYNSDSLEDEKALIKENIDMLDLSDFME